MLQYSQFFAPAVLGFSTRAETQTEGRAEEGLTKHQTEPLLTPQTLLSLVERISGSTDHTRSL